MDPSTTFQGTLTTPIGVVQLTASERGLTRLSISQESHIRERSNQHISMAIDELTDYFNGELKQFTIALDLPTSPGFNLRVWQQLLNINYGETTSYGEVASLLNSPGASQAVGAANAANPIGIIIPCHRVIGSDGALTGYAWGIEAKRWLLLHERRFRAVPAGQLFS
ncbi:MAG: methylated-DNA--[protein]-cysteine S-methyltransferase [Bacteroidota bacterium]